MCKLKPTDLKIYNYILAENKVYKIETFYESGVHVGLGKCFKFSEINPIPLSVDWLKKAGYKQLKRVEKTYSLSNFEDNSAIYFTGVRFIHIITGTHLEFLHELQNLHSAINKEELKFS